MMYNEQQNITAGHVETQQAIITMLYIALSMVKASPKG